MNPVEWLVYIAALETWYGPAAVLSSAERDALAMVIAKGSRRG